MRRTKETKTSIFIRNAKVLDKKITIPFIESLLKEAEIRYDKVSIEVERVYETIYDCIRRRLEAA